MLFCFSGLIRSIKKRTEAQQLENPATNYKDALYDSLAQLSRGFASNRRLEILDLLTQASKSVEEISKETGMSIANTSRHLQVLKDSHLVKTTRKGNHIIYRLASTQITDLIRLLINVGENSVSEMQEIEQQADNIPDVETLSLSEAYQMKKDSLMLDVRPRDEFAVKHVDDAINMPLDQLPELMKSLPKDQRIIVYCRGRLCVNANSAAQILRRAGFNAYSMNRSVWDWQDLSKVEE